MGATATARQCPRVVARRRLPGGLSWRVGCFVVGQWQHFSASALSFLLGLPVSGHHEVPMVLLPRAEVRRIRIDPCVTP